MTEDKALLPITKQQFIEYVLPIIAFVIGYVSNHYFHWIDISLRGHT